MLGVKIKTIKLHTLYICRRIFIRDKGWLCHECINSVSFLLLRQIFKLATMQLSPILHLLSQSKCQECTWGEWKGANSSPMMSLMSATCHTAHPAQRWLSVYKTRLSRAAHFLHWRGDNSVWGSSSQQGDRVHAELWQKYLLHSPKNTSTTEDWRVNGQKILQDFWNLTNEVSSLKSSYYNRLIKCQYED